MSLHAPKGKESSTTKNSLFEIPYTDPAPCRLILVYWTNATFICSLSFRFVKPKQESMGCRNEISSQISSSQITETRSCMNKLAFPPSILPPAVLRHVTCLCWNRQLEVVVAQIDGVHKLHTQKDFCRGGMCRSLAGCPKSCGREELVESHREPIELKVPRVVVENTELPCPQHSSVLLGDMPRERVVQNDGHNQCNNHRR